MLAGRTTHTEVTNRKVLPTKQQNDNTILTLLLNQPRSFTVVHEGS